MKKNFEYNVIIREHLDRIIQELSLEQLNQVPAGFNNNIIWNIGHVVVTQQLLIYALSGNKTCFDKAFIDAFRKGSLASQVTQETVDRIQNELFKPVTQTQADYSAGLFKEYKEYSTSFGITIASVEDAIVFNNIHEGLHLGYIMAMRKSV